MNKIIIFLLAVICFAISISLDRDIQNLEDLTKRVEAIETPPITIPLTTCLYQDCDKAQIYLYEKQAHQYIPLAFCESSMNPLAENNNSSATGIFQFITRTWDNYCEGDPKNYRDNIDCFLKLYPQHPDWWECDNIELECDNLLCNDVNI